MEENLNLTGTNRSAVFNNITNNTNIQQLAKMQQFNLKLEKLPHPQPVHPNPTFSIPTLAPMGTQLSSNFHVNNYITTPQSTIIGQNCFQQFEIYQRLLNQMLQNQILMTPSLLNTQQPQFLNSIPVATTNPEEHDSGNETSSLSPGTASPNSRSSRFF